MRKKICVAVVAGGYTGEFDVSLQSGNTIYQALDRELFDPYLIVWRKVKREDKEAYLEVQLHHQGKQYKVNIDDFTVELEGKILQFDYVFVAIHGAPGENGILQKYLDERNIPYSTGGIKAQADTFDKQKTKELAHREGIIVPKGVKFHMEKSQIDSEPDFSALALIQELRWPLFVKPCQGGSSLATKKVFSLRELANAMGKAANEDLEGEGLIEESVEGVEVTCGVLRLGDESIPLQITEVVTHGADFFDYEAKYSGSTDEITPARIPSDTATLIRETTLRLGDLFNLKGIFRADYIIDEKRGPVLLEINTVPGFTQESFIPKQIRATGLQLSEVLTRIIRFDIPEV